MIWDALLIVRDMLRLMATGLLISLAESVDRRLDARIGLLGGIHHPSIFVQTRWRFWSLVQALWGLLMAPWLRLEYWPNVQRRNPCGCEEE